MLLWPHADGWAVPLDDLAPCPRADSDPNSSRAMLSTPPQTQHPQVPHTASHKWVHMLLELPVQSLVMSSVSGLSPPGISPQQSDGLASQPSKQKELVPLSCFQKGAQTLRCLSGSREQRPNPVRNQNGGGDQKVPCADKADVGEGSYTSIHGLNLRIRHRTRPVKARLDQDAYPVRFTASESRPKRVWAIPVQFLLPDSQSVKPLPGGWRESRGTRRKHLAGDKPPLRLTLRRHSPLKGPLGPLEVMSHPSSGERGGPGIGRIEMMKHQTRCHA